jgi:hypothetical protein
MLASLVALEEQRRIWKDTANSFFFFYAGTVVGHGLDAEKLFKMITPRCHTILESTRIMVV